LKTQLNRIALSAESSRFALVVSRWNDPLTSKLADGAREALKDAFVADASIEIFHVPGAFELPLACLKAANTGDFDAVIALGVVIRGDTPHFDYVAGQAAAGILQASMQSGIPVMFGVITADYLQQAVDRTGEKADNKGYEAAMSAVEMVVMFREMDRRNNDAKVLPHVA
jgi:6,7-dimethyl-8-ribityllumazine synthase